MFKREVNVDMDSMNLDLTEAVKIDLAIQSSVEGKDERDEAQCMSSRNNKIPSRNQIDIVEYVLSFEIVAMCKS